MKTKITIALLTLLMLAGMKNVNAQCVQSTFYQDADGDGSGNPNISIMACTQPVGYVTLGCDPDDNSNLNRCLPDGLLATCDPANLNYNIIHAAACTPDDETDTIALSYLGLGYTWTVTPPDGNWYSGADEDMSGRGIFFGETHFDAPPGSVVEMQVYSLCWTLPDYLPIPGLGTNATVTLPCCQRTWYMDADNDGHYVSSTTSCESPGDGYNTTATISGDCNDNNASVHGPTAWYADTDGDDQGMPSQTPLMSCTQPAGYVANDLDPDDTRANVFRWDGARPVWCLWGSLQLNALSSPICGDSTLTYVQSTVGEWYNGTIFYPNGGSSTYYFGDYGENPSFLLPQGAYVSQVSGNVCWAIDPVTLQPIPDVGFTWVDFGASYTVPVTCSGNPASILSLGTNDSIQLPDISSSINNGVISFEAWIQSDSSTIAPRVVKNGNSNSGNVFELGAYLYHLPDVDLDGFQTVASITQLNGIVRTVYANSLAGFERVWHHLALVADGSVLHLYVDGLEVESTGYDGTLSPDFSSLVLGKMQGEMEEVRIWNRALCQQEIQQHMHCELTGNEPGLVAYYNFNQGIINADNSAITTVTDASPNHYDGTLKDFALTGLSSNWSFPFMLNHDVVSPTFIPFTGGTTFYADADNDSFGNAGVSLIACSKPAGYVANNTDCDDNNALVHVTQTWYLDADNDGHYVGSQSSCGSPGAGYNTTATQSGDCNDNDNTKWQSASLYVDADGDGYTVGSATSVCYGATVPTGYSVASSGSDCNDANPSVHATQTWYLDADNDGHYVSSQSSCGSPGTGYNTTANQSGDCNDNDNTKWQSASLYVDADGDGYTVGSATSVCYGATIPAGYKTTSLGTDCNDGQASVHPGATEICNNNIDDNCNGTIDEGCSVTRTYYLDGDRDGYGKNSSPITSTSPTPPAGYAVLAGDCDDTKSSVHPGATEVCNGIDDNCNGTIDEGVSQTYYRDADGDGYGNPAISKISCSKPKGYVTNNTDCNDSPAGGGIHPGAVEVCGNGIDDNCNGQVDENCGTACSNATNLTTTNITSGSATLNWVAAVNPVAWQVQYKTTAPGAKWKDVSPVPVPSARSVTISGLAAGQTYNWHIAAKCGNTWTSFADAASFKTLTVLARSTNAESQPLDAVEEKLSALKLYPNPSSGQFMVDLHLAERINGTAKLQLIDITGRTVYVGSAAINNGVLQKKVSISSLLSSGIYTVEIIANGKSYFAKLMYGK